MESIDLTDLGPPYTTVILSELLNTFGRPGECSADNEVAADNDASSFLPLLDEVLKRRENALSRDPPEAPRLSTSVNIGQDARPKRCRSIYGLYLEGDEEISLDYLGPNFRGGYDSDSGSVEPTDDPQEKESQAERSIYHDGEEVYVQTRHLEHGPENDQTTETNPFPENVEIRSRPSTAVRNEDSSDGAPSHVLHASLVAGAREHIAVQEKCADACSAEAISPATRTTAHSFILEVNGQADVPPVRSAIASLCPKARNTSAEATGAEKPEVSVYELESKVVSADEREAASATEKKSQDDETRHSKLGNEKFIDGSPTHARESVLMAGCRAYYDGEEYRAACSTEALFPPSAKAVHRSTGAVDNENSYFDGVCFPGAPSPEVCDSSPEPSRSYFDGECITIASSPDVRDSSPELPREADLNFSAYELKNEQLVQNATECIQILDNKPEEGETLNIVVAAKGCRQASLSRISEPLIIARDHMEEGHTGTYCSETTFPTPVSDSHCSVECSREIDDDDGAGSAGTSLLGVRYGYAGRFHEIHSKTNQLEFEPSIEKISQDTSATEHGFRDCEAPNVAIGYEDHDQSLPQKSQHIQAAQSHNDGEKKYGDACSTVTVSSAPTRSRDCAAKSLESEVEHYHGTGYVGVSLLGTHDSRTEFSRRADSNCAANQAEYDPKIQDVLVTEDASQDYDTLSPVIQAMSSPKHSPESLPVSWARIGADASEYGVSHDTVRVIIDDTESSEAERICENTSASVLAFSVPTARDICSEISREVYSMSSDDGTAYNQENKEKYEVVLIAEDTSQDKETPSTAMPTQSVLSPKCDPESLLVACIQARRDVSEDDVSHDTMAITTGDTEFSDAKSADQNDLTSALLSSLSEARDTCTQMLHQVDSRSSADQYDPQIKEADYVVIVTEDTSQYDDTLSTAIRNQSVLPPQLNPESLLVACTQVQRDVSEDDVSHGTMTVTPNDAEFSGAKSTRENDLPSALPSVSAVDSNFSTDQGIEEAIEVLVTEDTSQDNDTLNSAIRKQGIPSPEQNVESLLAYTRTPLDVSEDDVSHDAMPFMANDADSCEANSTLENNLSSALPSSSTVVCDSDIEIFQRANSNHSANLAEYDPHIKEADGVVLFTEDNSQDNDTLSTAIRNQNVSSPKHKTESLLVACTQAQRDVSEDDIARETMPVTVGDTESRASKSTSENNLRSNMSCPEDLRDAPNLYDEDLFKTVVRESLAHHIALKATPQNSKSELAPAALPPEPVKQLAMNILKCINATSFLPIYDYCPPSGSNSVTSRASSPPSLALLSEGEMSSDNESENVLPLSVLPKAAVSEGENVDSEYEPEAFLPVSPISVSTMSEGETADSVSDESTASPFLSSELHEAEKFGSEDTSTVSESTSSDTEDESTTSCSSSSSTRSYSSSTSTQSASDSEDSTESSLSSSPLSEPPRDEILEAQTVKEAHVGEEKTVGTEVAAAAVHSEPCCTQLASSGTDRLDHQDNKENVISTSLASVSALKEGKEEGLEYDTDIMIPLVLPIFRSTPRSMHSEPRYTLPASSGTDLPDLQQNRENGFPAFLASVPATKEDEKGFENNDDMFIPLSSPISPTMPSKIDAVESVHDLTAPSSATHFAQSDISGDKKDNSKYVSSTLPRLLPCPERLSGDGKAVKVEDALPPAPKKKKTKRNQKRQRKHPLQNDLRRRSKRTADIIERVPPKTSVPPSPNKRPPLISDDPAENWDNENPQWESMRRLSSEEERYMAVLNVWHSKRIPDPQKDLTTFHHRRRLLGLEHCRLPSSRRHRKRRASGGSGSRSDDAKRQRLDTDIFDKKLEDVEKSREREMAEAEAKLNRSLLKVRKYKRSERRRHSPGDKSSSSPRRPRRYRRQCSEDRSDPSPNRRSQRLCSSSESDRDSSPRRRRSRSRGYSDDASDPFPMRRRRGRSQPSRGTSDSPSMRRRTQRHHSSENMSVSSSSECRSDGSRKKVRRHRSPSLGNFSTSFRSSRSRRTGRRHTSEDDSDSSPRKRKRGRRDCFGSTSDTSPRRQIRGRRWSSESGDDDSCTRSRGGKQRCLSQSDNDRSPRKRSRDRMKSGDSPYWRRRERRIRENFEADMQSISSKYRTKVDKLVAAREEVSLVNSFYSGLRNTDPRMLSARQVKDHWKLELMLREMEKRYEPAQD